MCRKFRMEKNSTEFIAKKHKISVSYISVYKRIFILNIPNKSQILVFPLSDITFILIYSLNNKSMSSVKKKIYI